MTPENVKKPDRLFRSACSGLWYENPRAAGTIDAVEIKGHRIKREENEESLHWIRRVADWAEAIYNKEPTP